MFQSHLQPLSGHKRQSYDERVCSRCMGHRALCGVRPCPLIMRARAAVNIEEAVIGTELAGASPPAVFVGSYGYPKVLVGPLVPPLHGDETAVMERPDLWLDKTLDQILSMRFSLVRTKLPLRIDDARDPSRILAETQSLALSERPTTSDATLMKRPTFTTLISNRTLPIGPSAPLQCFQLEDNPSVPRAVNRITSDTDLAAREGIMALYNEGISQQHITRLFSVGLFGLKRTRRLVPTEWSITAVDDIIGRRLHRQILNHDWISNITVFADHALGNTIVVLMVPSAWQFEALECWLSGPDPQVISDHEWSMGRKDYASVVVGAYYATRLPVLERLARDRRQAAVLVFMEIDPRKWLPLGVWRFREIARRALSTGGQRFSDLREAIQEIGRHLKNSVTKYLEASVTYKSMGTQTRLTDYL